jgi:hypothetical protein
MNKPLGMIAAAIVMLSAITLGAGPAKAQAPEAARMLPGASVPCPNPVRSVITRPTSPGSQQPATILGTYNQTAVNQSFKDTFTFKPPQGQCCQFTSGRLLVTFKALQSGPANSSTSANDDAGLMPGPYPRIFTGAVTAGTIRANVPFTLTAAQLASGSVTLYVEDDTAVVSATLEIIGCCLTPHAGPESR